jgi:hypothetical protein
MDRRSQEPLLIQLDLGQGKVLYLATNECWRWRTPGGEEVERFFEQLTLAGAGQPPEAAAETSSAQRRETADLSGDEQNLRRLARDTGGRVIEWSELGDVAVSLSSAGGEEVRTTRLGLWDSPWLLAFVAACLSAEWALRKLLGLA